MKRNPTDPYGLGLGSQEQKNGFFASHKKQLLITAIALGALAFLAGWNPPTGSVHSFTQASEYSERRESGCTNSGAGCHGTDAELIDFNRYHPELECNDCHEYTGVGCIPCHGPAQHECTGCHDGSMDDVSDCVPLTGSYPNGHYRQSLHEAIGTDMDHVVHAAEGGTAKAACSACHSVDLKDAHIGVPETESAEYGPEVGCAECHNDEPSGALDQVLTKWEAHRCEDCHGTDSPSPMHDVDVAAAVEPSGSAGCGQTGAGCHGVNDLHALHPDAPESCGGAAAEGEPACHSLDLASVETTVTICGSGEGSCHAPYLNDSYSHESDDLVHTAPVQGSTILLEPKSGLLVTCRTCHVMEIADEHSRPGSSLGGGCQTCHNESDTTVRTVKESWSERLSSKACDACHGSKHAGIEAAHVATQRDESGAVAGDACVAAGCHATADVRVLHAAVGCTATGCHSASGRIVGGTMTCGGTDGQSGSGCHTGGAVHGSAKHTATEYSNANVATPGSCVKAGCHATTSVNELHRSAGCTISSCHAAGGPTGKLGCGGTDPSVSCHVRNVSYHTKNPNHHIGVEYSSSNVATPGSCVKSGCHTSNRLSTLHTNVGGCYGTAGCHVAGGPSMVIGCGGTDPSVSCHVRNVSYHTKNPNHHIGVEYNAQNEPAPGTCTVSGCHATTKLSTLHTNVGGCYGTAGCHVAGGPSMVIGCGGSDGSLSCHMLASLHTVGATAHDATEYATRNATVPNIPAEPGACTDAGCHATVDVRELHAPVGCFTAACHGGTPTAPLSCGGIGGYPESACHNKATAEYPDTYHLTITQMHTGVEIGNNGLPQPGACNCHNNPSPSATYTVTDVRRLPDPTPDTPTTVNAHSCHGTPGCHTVGGPSGATCGGTDGSPSNCHSTAASRSTWCMIPSRVQPTGVVWRIPHTDSNTGAMVAPSESSEESATSRTETDSIRPESSE